jgi:outer membrane protein TolC
MPYVREVLAKSQSRRAAASRLAASAEAIGPAGALPDPTLTIGAMSVPTPSFDLRAEEMTQAPAIQLQQYLPFPGKQGARAAVARAGRAVRAEVLGAADARLASAAAQSYYELAYARTALDIWRARAALAAQAVRVSEVRYATGAAPQTDALRARLRRAQLADEGQAITAMLAAAASRADALRGGPGDPIAAPLLVTAPGTRVFDVTREDLPPDSALFAELERRSPALRVARAEAERAARQARVLGIDWRPDFMLSLQYGSRLAGREAFLTGMLGVSVPLWAWRKQGPTAEAARLEALAADHDYADALARGRGELAAVHAELRALAARVALARDEILPLAQAASASALQRYQVGAVEFTAVLETQDDWFSAQLDLARLMADYGTARARLAALVGEEWYR